MRGSQPWRKDLSGNEQNFDGRPTTEYNDHQDELLEKLIAAHGPGGRPDLWWDTIGPLFSWQGMKKTVHA
jgi:hypothetical protein